MSTDLTWQTVSMNLNDTERLGSGLGSRLRGGEVIELISDVGGGKTTLVRSIAKGMGSKDTVGSPSFTLSREYRAGDKTLYHFDFYRLSDPGIVANELAEVIGDPLGVVVVEWANIVENVLPAHHLTIRIKTTSETKRQLVFEYPDNLQYLIPEES